MAEITRVNLGESVCISGLFYDWDNQIVLPENLTLTIFDQAHSTLNTFALDSSDQVESGAIECVYTPLSTGRHYISFSGIIAGCQKVATGIFDVGIVWRN